MAWLVVEAGGPEESLQVRTTTTIGRARSSALVVRDPSISRLHCTIHKRGAELWIQDNDSINGTWVNGAQIREEVKLRHRDLIQIGDAAIRVLDQPRAPEPPPPVARRLTPAPDLTQTITRAPSAPQMFAPDAGPSIENGLLSVGRAGELRVQLWNVRIDHGGFFLRIPLVDERPPSSRLHRYVAKGRQEALSLEPGDEAFEALVAEAQRDLQGLSERALVDGLTLLVYHTLGGLLPKARLDACLAWCAAQGDRPVPIGELIRIGAGSCRHRAFLFFHLARRLGLKVELYRGVVADSRHAWNVVRVGSQRLFVDTTLNVVLDNAREAEEAYGYHASRHDVPQQARAAPEGHLVAARDGGAEQVERFHFRHELRKVPGDEEAVLLLYPEGEAPDVRYLHVKVQVGAAAVAMFAMDSFASARVYAIVGDEAHYRMDALDREGAAKLRGAWAALMNAPSEVPPIQR